MAGTDRDFEIYKLLAEEVRESRKARRELANVFTSLNLAGVGALGFLRANDGDLPPALLVWLVVALVFTCVIWRTSNAYYSRLLQVKFNILYEYEARLGEEPFRKEWKGLGSRVLFKFFSVEKAMPILFVLGYVVFLTYSITWAQLMEMVVQQPLALFHTVAAQITGR